ncbi:hypothetical protein K5D32_02405 [Pseudomonas cichorii]|uniref:hypothetical protein n=1 Tax=Pseudomonas cichorii TaxID=36746 RepID=UPI001C8AD4AD|nr:hypothetical protein [Pseudomonas cichorii]MBX8528494.1 hypothetical protein [Pseudomonas cichorii]
MTKHRYTPGPWIHKGPDHFRDYNILHQGDALAVAAVVSNMRPSYEIKANAKLIAAAPELLEAAIAVLADLSERIDAAVAERRPSPVFAGIAALHDAVNKATA